MLEPLLPVVELVEPVPMVEPLEPAPVAGLVVGLGLIVLLPVLLGAPAAPVLPLV
jgi:hypothetical protein